MARGARLCRLWSRAMWWAISSSRPVALIHCEAIVLLPQPCGYPGFWPNQRISGRCCGRPGMVPVQQEGP
eukprot:12880573-Prorocentrum_lima.AAC.1